MSVPACFVGGAAAPPAPAPAPVHSHVHVAPVAAEAAPQSKPHGGEHPGTVKSPMVGTVYRAPSPGAANFIDIGGEVKEGQTLLIIEAM